ncbi:MAG: 3-hydroxyacyl-CoA dehydrogenase NAD-binding domain-containing protein [Castellaniella sp.]
MQQRRLERPSTSHCLVVGGGTMGEGIAILLLRAGVRRLSLVEPRLEAHAALRERIAQALAQLELPAPAQRLHLTGELSDLALDDVDLVIECIPEVLAQKQALFRELAACMPPDTLLTSNSSSFPISAIAAGLPGPGRMLGLHFFMPAHVVPLVEVVLGEHSDIVCAEDVMAFMRRCGSVPILVRKDVPGFIANRLQHALAREAFSLIEQGIASVEDVDAAVRFGFGFRYLAAGPVMQKEHAGIDIHAAAAATIYPSLCNAGAPAAVLADKAASGRLGMKSGEGFYTWDAAGIAHERARYARVLADALKAIADELPAVDP